MTSKHSRKLLFTTSGSYRVHPLTINSRKPSTIFTELLKISPRKRGNHRVLLFCGQVCEAPFCRSRQSFGRFLKGCLLSFFRHAALIYLPLKTHTSSRGNCRATLDC